MEEDAQLEVPRQGRVVGTEISYWANPFPLLKDNDGTIIHKNLYEKYTDTEEELVSTIEKLV